MRLEYVYARYHVPVRLSDPITCGSVQRTARLAKSGSSTSIHPRRLPAGRPAARRTLCRSRASPSARVKSRALSPFPPPPPLATMTATLTTVAAPVLADRVRRATPTRRRDASRRRSSARAAR